MTKPIIKKVACPNCGAEGDFTVYISINFGLNPELYEKMLNGDLSIWECPKCGKKYKYISKDKLEELSNFSS